MKVVDLYAGLKGWSQPFSERGHETWTVELLDKFEPDLVADVLDVTPEMCPFEPDVVLASPPCTCFSVMTIGRHWTKEHQPKTERAVHALSLVEKTLELIEAWRPAFFVIENPRAKLRALPVLKHLERRTVTYCAYGETRMKPTDLWGGFPPSLELHPPCRNGDPCHTRAPRGSATGTQGGLSAEESAKIPRRLALAVCLAAERDVAEGRARVEPELQLELL